MTDHTPRSARGGGYRCTVCRKTARTLKEMRATPCGGRELLALAQAEADAAEDSCSDEAMLAFDDEDDEDA